MNIWHFLYTLICRNKFWFIASCVLAMIPSTLTSISALYYAKIIGIIGANPKDALSNTVITCLIISAFLCISQDLIQGLRIYVDARMKIRYQRTMHNTLFQHTHRHSARFFNTEQSGKILAKMGDLTFGMFQLFGNLLYASTGNVFQIFLLLFKKFHLPLCLFLPLQSVLRAL